MNKHNNKPLDNVMQIDESQIRGHLGELVHGTVEDTLNRFPDAEDRPAPWRRAQRGTPAGLKGPFIEVPR